MANNFVQPGDVVTVSAPTGGVVSGAAFQVADLVGVAMFDAAEGEQVEMAIEGVFNLPSSESTQGAKVYWDDIAKTFTAADVGNTRAGVVVQGGVSTSDIKLTPGAGS